MERGNSELQTQLDAFTREVRALASQLEHPPSMVYPPCGWNGPRTKFCPPREQWTRMEEGIPSMYPYQNYNHQASYDQEFYQRGNFDQESYQQAIYPRILDMEKSIERIGIQLAQCVKISQEQEKEEPLTYLGQVNPKETEEDEDELDFMRDYYADMREMAEIYLAREREECPNHIEQEEKEEPPRLHKSTNPFFALTVDGIIPVEYLESSESDLGEVLLKVQEELKDEEELGVEKGKEVLKPVESSDSSEGDLGEILLKFEEELRLEKEGKEVDLVKENAELLSLNVDYILRVDLVEKERDSSLREIEELKNELAQRDEALEIMKTRELDHLAKLAKAKQELKAKGKEVIPLPKEDKLDLSQGISRAKVIKPSLIKAKKKKAKKLEGQATNTRNPQETYSKVGPKARQDQASLQANHNKTKRYKLTLHFHLLQVPH